MERAPQTAFGLGLNYRGNGKLSFQTTGTEFPEYCNGTSSTKSWGAEKPASNSCTVEAVPWGSPLP